MEMDGLDGIRLALAFGSGLAISWFGYMMRAKTVKQATDDDRVVEWSRLLGSIETSIATLNKSTDAIEARIKPLEVVPVQLCNLSKAVLDIQARVTSQSRALDNHAKEETQILRDLKAISGG